MVASYGYGIISPKENMREKNVEYSYVKYENGGESY
jgi:hypothetical protein